MNGKKGILSRGFLTVVVIYILACTAWQFLGSLLIAYGTEALGMDKVLVASISGIIATAALVMRPVNGLIMDKFNKKILYALSLLVLAGSIFGFAMSKQFYQLYIFQILRGIAWALLCSIGNIMAGEMVEEKELHTAISIYYMGQTIANVFGATLALSVVNSSGYQAAFFAGAGCAVVASVLAITLPYSEVKKEGNHQSFMEGIKGIRLGNLFCAAAIPMCVMNFLFQIMQTALGNSYVVAFCRGELGLANAGIFAAVSSGIMWASRPLGGKLADRFGSKWVFIPSCIGYGAACLLLAQAYQLTTVLMAAVIYGVCSGTAMPIIQSTVLRTVDESQKGVATSTRMIGGDIGLMAGNMMMATVATNFGGDSYRASYMSMIVVAAAALIFIVAYMKVYNAKHEGNKLGW